MDYILIVLLLMCVICMAMAFLMKGMYGELDILRVENTVLRLQLHWLKETDPDTFNKLIERKEIEK